AQRLMPVEDGIQAALEDSEIQRTGELHRRRHVIGDAARVPLIQEPQTLLRERSGKDEDVFGAFDDGRRTGMFWFGHRVSIVLARPAMVGVSNSERSEILKPRASFMRAATCVASSEWPPRSKKSSWTPIGSIRRTSLQMRAIVCSIKPRGGTNACGRLGR